MSSPAAKAPLHHQGPTLPRELQELHSVCPFLFPHHCLPVLYIRLWTGNVTVYILLDLVRKSLSRGAVTLGQESQGKTALGFSPQQWRSWSYPSHPMFPQTNICSCHDHHALSRDLSRKPASSALILQSRLHSTVVFIIREREKIIFSMWLFRPLAFLFLFEPSKPTAHSPPQRSGHCLWRLVCGNEPVCAPCSESVFQEAPLCIFETMWKCDVVGSNMIESSAL